MLTRTVSGAGPATPRRLGWIGAGIILGALLIGPSVGAVAAQGEGNPGSIWTSNATGQTVNQNIYASADAVYLNGGPQNCNGTGLPDGDYYFQVTIPSGNTTLSTDPVANRRVTVSGGFLTATSGTHALGTGTCPGSKSVQLIPFNASNNGEYKVYMKSVADCEADGDCVNDGAWQNAKTDNFKVGTATTTSTCGVSTVTVTVPTTVTATTTVPTTVTQTVNSTVTQVVTTTVVSGQTVTVTQNQTVTVTGGVSGVTTTVTQPGQTVTVTGQVSEATGTPTGGVSGETGTPSLPPTSSGSGSSGGGATPSLILLLLAGGSLALAVGARLTRRIQD